MYFQYSSQVSSYIFSIHLKFCFAALSDSSASFTFIYLFCNTLFILFTKIFPCNYIRLYNLTLSNTMISNIEFEFRFHFCIYSKYRLFQLLISINIFFLILRRKQYMHCFHYYVTLWRSVYLVNYVAFSLPIIFLVYNHILSHIK